MKVKVRATDISKKYGIRISDVKRIVEPGEEFEIEESRLKLLEGKNIWGYKFVERIKDKMNEKVQEKAKPKIEEPIPVPTDPVLKPEVVEKPAKKRTSKKKKESE